MSRYGIAYKDLFIFYILYHRLAWARCTLPQFLCLTLVLTGLIYLPQADAADSRGSSAVQTRSLPAANTLVVNATCDGVNVGEHIATFHWVPSKNKIRRQRVETTAFRGGFDNKQSQIIATLKPTDTHVEWRGGNSGINYYWRVMSEYDKGWVASRNARYSVPICPVDFEAPVDVAK